MIISAHTLFVTFTEGRKMTCHVHRNSRHTPLQQIYQPSDHFATIIQSSPHLNAKAMPSTNRARDPLVALQLGVFAQCQNVAIFEHRLCSRRDRPPILVDDSPPSGKTRPADEGNG